MKPSEAAMLLTKIAFFDRRTVGEADARAWAEALDGIGLDDAMAVATQHFQTSSEWLMPIHIINRVKAIRTERLRNAPVMDIPADLHQAVERQWVRAFTDAVKDGHSDPQAAADEGMGIRRLKLPPPDKARLVRVLQTAKGDPA
jgi:hypothetical protein